MSIAVKVVLKRKEAHEGVIRRFTVPDDITDGLFDIIKNKVTELFTELRDDVHVLFHWKDSDGDIIVFSSEEEAQEAVKSAKDGVLHLTVSEVGKDELSAADDVPVVLCNECKVQVSSDRYVCMTCPDFNLCEDCEKAGHHIEHDMVRLVQHSLDHLDQIYFPEDGNGEFLPSRRFIRWMNRFSRRWHKRNRCSVQDGYYGQNSDSDNLNENRCRGRQRCGAKKAGNLRKCGYDQKDMGEHSESIECSETKNLHRHGMRRLRRRMKNKHAENEDVVKTSEWEGPRPCGRYRVRWMEKAKKGGCGVQKRKKCFGGHHGVGTIGQNYLKKLNCQIVRCQRGFDDCCSVKKRCHRRRDLSSSDGEQTDTLRNEKPWKRQRGWRKYALIRNRRKQFSDESDGVDSDTIMQMMHGMNIHENRHKMHRTERQIRRCRVPSRGTFL